MVQHAKLRRPEMSQIIKFVQKQSSLYILVEIEQTEEIFLFSIYKGSQYGRLIIKNSDQKDLMALKGSLG